MEVIYTGIVDIAGDAVAEVFRERDEHPVAAAMARAATMREEDP